MSGTKVSEPSGALVGDDVVAGSVAAELDVDLIWHASMVAGTRVGGQQEGNRPRRTPTIPNELAGRKPAFQSTPTHSTGPLASSHNPKVAGSNPAPAIRWKPLCGAAFGVLGGGPERPEMEVGNQQGKSPRKAAP